MPPFGPTYCETPSFPFGGFPVEPWNAYSSMIIVMFGLAAFALVRLRAPRDWLMHGMAVLLMVNGVGSVLWHGLRTRWALNLDVLPALVFLALLAVLWARRLMPWWQVGLLLVFIFAGNAALRQIDLGLSPQMRLVASTFPLVLAGLWLVLRTAPKSSIASGLGLACLTSAAIAMTARTLDPLACAAIPFGSHFLWHVFLSTAAFLGFWTLLILRHPPAPHIAQPTRIA